MPSLDSEYAKKLTPTLTIGDTPSEVFCVRFSPDGKYLAAGCGDGSIRIYTVATGRLSYNINVGHVNALPTTGLRWRPLTTKSKTKNVLLAVNAEGAVQHWHVTSGRCMHQTVEAGNQLYCVDYRADGESFAAAGKDYTVRLYDEATKTMVQEMSGGRLSRVTPGHSNRVFSLKFNPDDENMLLSGGWDNTVQIWDVRVGHSVRSIFGPHICGDSMDIKGGQILTGSWRPDKQLEVWDFGTGELVETIPWHQSKIHGENCMLYAAQFNKAGTLIGAGGSGANEAKIFDRSRGNALVGTIAGLKRGVFTLDWSDDDTFAVAGGDSAIRMYQVEADVPLEHVLAEGKEG